MRAGDDARPVRFGAILLLAAIPRIWAAIWDQGIFWPDEIFQTLEPAHRFAFGYGFVAWEFQDGARSFLFPGVLGLWWKLLAAFGVSGAPALVVSAKLAMVALALVGIYASMRIGETLGGAEAAVLCGVLGAVFPPSIVYGSRCMTEMASGPLCVVAVLLVLDRKRWKLVVAGCLAALMISLRYQNGIITLALFGWLLAQRRHSDALSYAAGAALTGLAGGLLDLVTWGVPFHSLVTYIRFNLIEGKSANFGVEPLAYYVEVFWSAVGVSSLAVAIGLCNCARRAPGFLLIVLVYVLAHTLVPHKEFRFLMPIVPLMLTLSGIGLVLCIDRFLAMLKAGVAAAPVQSHGARTPQDEWRRNRMMERRERDFARPQVKKTVWVVAGVLAAAMGWTTARASFDDFGQWRGPLSGRQSVWHAAEAANRLLWAAGARPDLCGLALVGYGRVWTGGYTYLHRDVPILYAPATDALTQPGLGAIGAAANYVLMPARIPLLQGYVTIETIGAAKLARRLGSCATPPDSYTRLFARP